MDLSSLATLKNICISRQLVRCDECCFVDPNYGEPHCIILTTLDSRYKGKKSLYKLQTETVPKKCKYWLSAKEENKRRDSTQKLKHVQSLIDMLTPAERKKIKV